MWIKCIHEGGGGGGRRSRGEVGARDGEEGLPVVDKVANGVRTLVTFFDAD